MSHDLQVNNAFEAKSKMSTIEAQELLKPDTLVLIFTNISEVSKIIIPTSKG